MRDSRRKWRMHGLVVLLGLGLVGWRILRECVPSGADVLPWMLASVDGGSRISPDGRCSFRVVFNDAGAAHSGNHWTWIVQYRWWRGWYVVSEGYVAPEVVMGDVAGYIRWVDRRSFGIYFATRRYGEDWKNVRVVLD